MNHERAIGLNVASIWVSIMWSFRSVLAVIDSDCNWKLVMKTTPINENCDRSEARSLKTNLKTRADKEDALRLWPYNGFPLRIWTQASSRPLLFIKTQFISLIRTQRDQKKRENKKKNQVIHQQGGEVDLNWVIKIFFLPIAQHGTSTKRRN